MAASELQTLAQKLNALNLEGELPRYPNCFPEVNPVDIYRAYLTSILAPITGVDAAIVYPALQWTNTLDKGDMVLPIPALRIKGKKPQDLGEEWVQKFPESPLVQKPTITGTFIQFFFKPEKLAQLVIPDILTRQGSFGQNKFLGLQDLTDPSKGQKKMIVEFSSPNIAKPFHAGHLRSTIIGGFLANLYDAAGWNVTRINYLGDWGKQYGILALGYKKYGNKDELEADPINHLFNVYVKISKEKEEEETEIKTLKEAGEDTTQLRARSIDEKAREYFKAMTDNEPEAIQLWSHFRELSIKRYKETYARLNIRFDEYSGESQVKQEQMDIASKKIADMGISKESDGAVIIDFSEQKGIAKKEASQLGVAVIKKKDGTALYLTRDISEMVQRHEKYRFDHMIYVVASQQDLHLKQLFKIIDLMGYDDLANKVQHINFGMVLGMSTRKGTVKFLDDILRDVADKMHEVMKANDDKYQQVENPEATADILGISSVMVQDLSGKRGNNYTFDINVMTSFEGDTGPYLQYAHARLCSITRKSGLTPEEVNTADLSLLTEPHAVNLIRIISQYPDVFVNTLKTLEPTTVLTYLFRMTHVLSSSYPHLKVVNQERELQLARAALYDAAKVVLANGMKLIGLSPVERM